MTTSIYINIETPKTCMDGKGKMQKNALIKIFIRC